MHSEEEMLLQFEGGVRVEEDRLTMFMAARQQCGC